MRIVRKVSVDMKIGDEEKEEAIDEKLCSD